MKLPRRRWPAVFALAALLPALVSLSGCAAPEGRRADPAAALDVAPVKWRERRLANGLQVISVEQHASPTVSVQVWYHVGGRDDPDRRSGFAHLFEHLMFKSTANLKNEQFDRLTEDVGGENNAFTSDDVTGYQEVVPSNHLEAMIWAEAERMANLRVDDANFASERAVVKEEYRQSVLASPYGKLFRGIAPASYLQHPYKRTPIGSIEDLDAATLADVVAFHARYYRPDNATLVVAGDFEPRQLDAWVDKYFVPVPRPAAPLVPFAADEPAWPSDRSVTLRGPRVPLPAVALTWLAPPVKSRDSAALRVAAAVLSGGESARINQSLVYRQQIAAQAGFEADLRAGPGLLTAYAIVAGGKTVEEVRTALLAEVMQLAAVPPTAAEMSRVKNQLVTAAFMSRQTPHGLASAFGEAAVLEGDPERVNSDLVDLQRVTAEDVQRVMRRYVERTHRVTIDYRQEGGES